MQIRSYGMCKLEWNLKLLPKALWMYLRGISFHSWKFSLYSLCIQEHLNAENLCYMSTFFNPPLLKLLHNVSCFIFARLFLHGKIFCIYSSSSRKEFEIIVSNAKYTILEIASDLKIIIFPSSYSVSFHVFQVLIFMCWSIRYFVYSLSYQTPNCVIVLFKTMKHVFIWLV